MKLTQSVAQQTATRNVATFSAYVLTWLEPVEDLPARVRISSTNGWHRSLEPNELIRQIKIVAERLAYANRRMHLTFSTQTELDPILQELSSIANVDCVRGNR